MDSGLHSSRLGLRFTSWRRGHSRGLSIAALSARQPRAAACFAGGPAVGACRATARHVFSVGAHDFRARGPWASQPRAEEPDPRTMLSRRRGCGATLALFSGLVVSNSEGLRGDPSIARDSRSVQWVAAHTISQAPEKSTSHGSPPRFVREPCLPAEEKEKRVSRASSFLQRIPFSSLPTCFGGR